MADVPAQWVDRLFDRFTAIFGAQKVAGMWAGASMPLVKQTWAEQLGRIDPDLVRYGLQRCVDEGLDWPPTLPEFVALCRRTVAGSHRPAALPPPASRERAAENLQRVQGLFDDGIGAGDAMFWAKRPRSAASVRVLVNGAERNARLARILLSHFDDDGAQCRSPEARAEIVRYAARIDHLQLAATLPTRTPGEDDE